jgi:hypothetical protein
VGIFKCEIVDIVAFENDSAFLYVVLPFISSAIHEGRGYLDAQSIWTRLSELKIDRFNVVFA